MHAIYIMCHVDSEAKVLGGGVHPVKKSMWAPSTYVDARLQTCSQSNRGFLCLSGSHTSNHGIMNVHYPALSYENKIARFLVSLLKVRNVKFKFVKSVACRP